MRLRQEPDTTCVCCERCPPPSLCRSEERSCLDDKRWRDGVGLARQRRRHEPRPRALRAWQPGAVVGLEVAPARTHACMHGALDSETRRQHLSFQAPSACNAGQKLGIWDAPAWLHDGLCPPELRRSRMRRCVHLGSMARKGPAARAHKKRMQHTRAAQPQPMRALRMRMRVRAWASSHLRNPSTSAVVHTSSGTALGWLAVSFSRIDALAAATVAASADVMDRGAARTPAQGPTCASKSAALRLTLILIGDWWKARACVRGSRGRMWSARRLVGTHAVASRRRTEAKDAGGLNTK